MSDAIAPWLRDFLAEGRALEKQLQRRPSDLHVGDRVAFGVAGSDDRNMHAAAAKVSTDTVAGFERGDELKERTIDAHQRALEAAGIEFTNGVRLPKAAAGRSAEPGSAQSRREALCAATRMR